MAFQPNKVVSAVKIQNIALVVAVSTEAPDVTPHRLQGGGSDVTS